MRNIILTGGTGTIGKQLTSLLLQKACVVYTLTRKPSKKISDQHFLVHWDYHNQHIDASLLPKQSYTIIHLVGASVVNNAWTKKYRKEIIDSRVQSLEFLIAYFGSNCEQIISASGINGYYNTNSSKTYTEKSPILTQHFLGNVCHLWEQAALTNQLQIPKACLRTGTVLAQSGGAFPLLNKVAKLGLLMPLGSGNQLFPWIHISDLCNMYLHILENKLSGAFNAVATEQTSQKSLFKILCQQQKRWLFPPLMPNFLLKTILGKRASIFLTGGNISNEKIRNSGFSFQYPKVKNAISQLITS